MKRERSIHLGENEDNKQSQSDSYQSKSDSSEGRKMFGRGLDCGTGNFVSAFYENDEVQTLLIRDAFTVIDADKHKLKMIKDRNEDFILKDDKIYLIGEKAKVYSNIFGSRYPLRRPLAKGVLNPEEKDSHFVVREILKSLLGSPKIENEIVYFSVPAEPLDATFNQIFHENKFISLLDGLGFDGRPINEAKCVMYAEGADYGYSGVSISFGAGMCLDGNTKIPLLDGSVQTIEELSKKYSNKKFWVFSCLEDGTIVPALAWNPHKVKNAEIMRLWFDNGEFLDCTKDHKIMMRDGTYKEAQFLKEKDSLMPLYLSESKLGNYKYKQVIDNKTKRKNSLHRLIYKRFYGVELGKTDIIHHCNFNPLDNRPDNLQLVSRSEHQIIHKQLNKWVVENLKGKTFEECYGVEKTKQIKIKMSVSQKKIDGKTRFGKKPAHNKNRTMEECYGVDKAQQLKKQISKKVSEVQIGVLRTDRETRFCECGCGLSKEVKITSKWRFISNHSQKIANRKGVSVSDETKHVLRKKALEQWKNTENKNKLLLSMRNVEARKIRSESAKKMWEKRRLKKGVLNHKITKIEYLNKSTDVYDMTVDKYHNFAIDSGIFVHNCNVAISFENDSSGLEFSLTKPGKDITKDESYGCGDWIDKNAALAIGKEVHEIIDIKEEFDSNGKQKLDLINPETEEHFAIAVYYKNLIRYVVANIKNGIDNLKNIPRISQPIPIFITGGTSMAPGFIQLFESEWKKYKWPFEISEIKHVDPLRTVATGALVAAISEY